MTEESRKEHREAWVHWRDGRPLEAGRLIFEGMPEQARPAWAAEILRLVLLRSGVDGTPFEQVLHTAEHRALWGNGHRAFSALRRSVLELDQQEKTCGLSQGQILFRSVLSLAELVAKVTYNAADPPDPFDEDSGWWIAAFLHGFLERYWNDDGFAQAAWSVLQNRGHPGPGNGAIA